MTNQAANARARARHRASLAACVMCLAGMAFGHATTADTSASEPQAAPASHTEPATPAAAETAATLVVLYRGLRTPFAARPTVIVSGVSMGPLAPGSYLEMRVQRGEYRVQFDWAWQAAIGDRETVVDLREGGYAYVYPDNRVLVAPVAGNPTPYTESSMGVRVEASAIPGAVDGLRRQHAAAAPWLLPDATTVAGSAEALALADDAERLRQQIDGDATAQKLASREIVRRALDVPALAAAARAQVLKRYRSTDLTDLEIDALAWLCHAVAVTARPEHAAFLEDVAANASEDKVRRYARSYLERYFPRQAPGDD